jgi:hypothetical protein
MTAPRYQDLAGDAVRVRRQPGVEIRVFSGASVSWLSHFDEADRAAAYRFIKTRLVYISALEMQRVIETFVPETVTPYLRRSVAAELGIKALRDVEDRRGIEGFQAPSAFLRRATEYVRDDESFLSIVSPTPLTIFGPTGV